MNQQEHQQLIDQVCRQFMRDVPEAVLIRVGAERGYECWVDHRLVAKATSWRGLLRRLKRVRT